MRAIIRRKPFWSSLAFVGEYLIWTYIWFYLAWGLNYFRMDFYSRTGIRPTHFSSEAFNAFLHDEIGFLQMSEVIETAMQTSPFIAAPTLEDFFDTDKETRLLTKELINKKN